MSAAQPESTAFPSFRRIGPVVPATPVVVAVPHAGRLYPDELLAQARVGLDVLESLEDRHAERLAEGVAAAGGTVFVADRARAWIDLNRGEREFDPRAVQPRPPAGSADETVRVRGGLGLVPQRAAGGATLWRGPLSAAGLARRIAEDHRPWHLAVSQALARARDRFGVAVLLDLHSMPPLASGTGLVLGDRHGRSAGPALRRAALAILHRDAGARVALNSPYAGGHTLDRHGRPASGVHALQLEIDRALYLDAALDAPGPGLAGMTALVADLAGALAAAAAPPFAQAAE